MKWENTIRRKSMNEIDFQMCMDESNFIDSDSVRRTIEDKRINMDIMLRLNFVLNELFPNIKFSDCSPKIDGNGFRILINGKDNYYHIYTDINHNENGFISIGCKKCNKTFTIHLDEDNENIENDLIKYLYRCENPLFH